MASVQVFFLHDLCAGVLSAWPLCESFVFMTSVQEFGIYDLRARVLY
jgi:hypothetical protein